MEYERPRSAPVGGVRGADDQEGEEKDGGMWLEKRVRGSRWATIVRDPKTAHSLCLMTARNASAPCSDTGRQRDAPASTCHQTR